MKKTIYTLLCLAFLAITITACKDKAKEATTTESESPAMADETMDSDAFAVDTSESNIIWKGFKPTGTHHGVIGIDTGSFDVADGKIVGGSFIIDMNSIVVKDLPADDEKNGKLTGHLKSADFFDVEKHPNASFTITSLEEVDGKLMLSGNLSLKEKKNNVTFPVTFSKDQDTIMISSEKFTIDRSKWNVQYGSKSFFDNLGDKFINDDIELKVDVKAVKS